MWKMAEMLKTVTLETFFKLQNINMNYILPSDARTNGDHLLHFALLAKNNGNTVVIMT
jgi:hypothetical protein